MPPWSLPHEPRLEVLEALAAWSGGVLHTPILGLPVTHPGHIDVVYDTVGKPETFEVAVRVLAERGTLVYTGVSTPERWEWSPVYFKELTVTGSNAFGVEELDGVRKHAIAHYLDLVADGRIDITGMLTHRFTLDDWRGALRVPGPCRRRAAPSRWPSTPAPADGRGSVARSQRLEAPVAVGGRLRPHRVRVVARPGAGPAPRAVDRRLEPGRHPRHEGAAQGRALGHGRGVDREPRGVGHGRHPGRDACSRRHWSPRAAPSPPRARACSG